MPKIAEFEGPSGRLDPSQAGIEANVQAGRRIGVYYHQIGEETSQTVKNLGDEYRDEQYRQELSHGLATQANGWAGLSQSLNQSLKNADPNDPAAAENWRQQNLEPWLEQFQQSFQTDKGKAWAQEEAGRMRQHFTEASVADQATLAGIAEKQNTLETVNGFGAAARADGTTGGIDRILGTMEGGIDARIDSHANLTAESAATIKAEVHSTAKPWVVAQGIEGMIDSGPAGIALARSTISSGKYASILDKGETDHLLDYADTKERHNAELLKSQDETNRKALEDQGKGEYADIQFQLSQLHGAAPPPALTKRIHDFEGNASYRSLLPQETVNLGTALNENLDAANTNKYQPTNPATITDFSRRIAAGPGSPSYPSVSDIDKAYWVDHSISPKTWTDLRETVDKAQHDERYAGNLRDLDRYLTSLRPLITKSQDPMDATGNPTMIGVSTDAQGMAAYGEMVREAHAEFAIRYKQNPETAFSSLTDVNSPTAMSRWVPYFKDAGASGDATGYFRSNPVARSGAGGGGINATPTPQGGASAQAAQAPTGTGAAAAQSSTPLSRGSIVSAPDAAKIGKAGAIKPGESWSDYKARAGL